MGNFLFRNRFWYYRSLYDDYALREFRMAYMIAGTIYIPFYVWGIHINREIEVNNAHLVYIAEQGPKRLRLTQSLMYEMFEMDFEKYSRLKDTIDRKFAETQALEELSNEAENEGIANAFADDDDQDEDQD